jgi:type I restriction enzyme S subunit
VITDLKPYEAYKESGLPWLGRVPSHWELIPNRGLVRRRKVLVGQRHSDYQLLSLTKQGVIVRDISQGGKFSSDMGTSQEVRKGDLIFCLFDVPETPRTVGLSRHDGMITGAYTVFEFLGTGSPDYFDLFYRAMDDRKLLSPLYSGLRNTIPAERFRAAKTPQPPSNEQGAIVRFLNWANARLERAIRGKQSVIALVNQQKQAVIYRAVTRGLDSSVPLKPSGIPWLGGIPQHWEMRRLKTLCQFVTSGSRGWARYYSDAGSVFLRIGNISTTSIDLRLKRITYVTPPAGAEGERTRAIPNDLLLSITAQIGAVGVVPDGLGEAFVNQHTALIRLRPQWCVPRWVAYGLLSQFGKDQCWLKTNGGTKVGLTLDDVRCLLVPLPPFDEQLKLVAGIEDQTRDLDLATSRLEREIELLREYGTCLVADVVTGKLDVRTAAARLPEEAAPDVAPDDAELIEETEPAEEEVV